MLLILIILAEKAKMGEKEWFFFCQRDRKYPTGMRTNRATETGYWKATGKDKEIYRGRNCLVGMKKTLVFYKGRAPKGEKTNWVMHEFRLEGNFFSNYNFSRAAKEEFVVCRVFHKNSGIRKSPGIELSRPDSFVDRLLLEEIPPLMDYNNTLNEGGGGEDYNVNPSSRVFWSNHNVPPQTYPMIASNTFSIPQNAPPSSFLPQYYYQDQAPPLLSHGLSYQEYQRPKMENFSSNNSVMSHSQDTGLSTENVANHEITSKKAELDDDQGLRALAFSPNISDLDSLWSY